MVFNALGPLVAAVVVDYTGSYAPALLGFAVINVLSALLVLAARPPRLSKPPAASVA
jgi:cyanate permease